MYICVGSPPACWNIGDPLRPLMCEVIPLADAGIPWHSCAASATRVFERYSVRFILPLRPTKGKEQKSTAKEKEQGRRPQGTVDGIAQWSNDVARR